MQKTNLAEKKVLVFGTGISGIGAAKLLEKVQAEVILYDGNEKLCKEEIRKKLPNDSKCEIVLGALSEELLESLDLVVMSPGVPLDIPAVEQIKAAGIPIWGEIELAYQMSEGMVLAITGTNGKNNYNSSFRRNHESLCRVCICGGKYWKSVYRCSFVTMTEDSYTVAEISSFQLETIDTFAPKVSAILNITEDHLNRHHTMEEYIRVKELITKNQTKEDYCILNYEDEVLREFGEKCPAKTVFFSSERKLEKGVFLDGDVICLKTDKETFEIVKTEELKILGKHNYENVMAASAMAYYAGVPMEVIHKAVTQFRAVAHRIEFVEEIDGIAYYNDSKGTNPDAAIKGIQAMNRPTLLIGGGYDKESSYEEWIQSFDGKVKYLVLIGQTREKIQEAAHKCGFMNTILADNLEEAVSICTEKAEKGDAVLLSPACASWGQFDNYEQRGDKFKEYVYALKKA